MLRVDASICNLRDDRAPVLLEVPLLQTFHLYGAFGWSDREFGEALEALASILESESPVTGSRDKVEREMRRMGYT